MEFISCNICGSDKYREVCDIRIAPLTTPSKLVRCEGCGLFYANPRLEREAEEEYYRKRYHEDYGEDYWYERRIDVFKRALRRIEGFIKHGKLIDVGCGKGYFMDLAKNNGWEVKGVEISDSAVDHARQKLKLDVVKGGLRDAHLEAEYFDVATMWNVLDHMRDPRSDLIEINRILKKGGYFFIRVSNLYFHLRLFRLCKGAPSVFHLYSFDKDSIRKLLESTGFSDVIVRTEPMGLSVRGLVNVFGKKGEGLARRLLDFGAKVIYLLTLGNIVASPSIFVIARKKPQG